MPAVARAIYVKCSWSAVKWMTIASDHDYNDKKINTVELHYSRIHYSRKLHYSRQFAVDRGFLFNKNPK